MNAHVLHYFNQLQQAWENQWQGSGGGHWGSILDVYLQKVAITKKVSIYQTQNLSLAL
jgi:hypothetical protein